ncbi:MAG: UDP-N-acetylmuramate--L-alanine ligase [Flavobacteriales bacterium]|nr:UDP-N-acetylmuramate--L-alanine ligase [Flavobacteriales bacterium]
MKFDRIEIYYFLGIGGIGMSALARYFHSQGKAVMGYDRTSTPLTIALEMEGIDVHYDDNVINIPQIFKVTDLEKILVVITPAIPAESMEWAWFRDQGFSIKKRSEVLGLITASTKTIAIAGTHGKTTTSSLAAHILTSSGHGCNAFLGGITANYNSNLLISHRAEWTVVEADEYDRSFLTLSPDIAVITSMDADHLDIYGSEEYVRESFNLFAAKLKQGGSLIVRTDLPLVNRTEQAFDYSAELGGDFFASNIHIKEGRFFFDFYFDHPLANGVWKELELGIPGRHNIENAVAATAAALILGIGEEAIRTALSTFKGVKRRFEYILKTDELVFIDDYAHHPEEIRAMLNAMRELYPDKKVTGVFQPHLFSRTRDFGDAFGEILGQFDEIILLPIYPARERPLPEIDSQWLLDKISGNHKKLVEKNELLDELFSRNLEVVVTIGAGDIDEWVVPIKNMLLKR